ncbi:MAG: hypothetical protein KGZ59_00665 [Chitinophagaceae bacterium]|nr:hypothetical protein [Chitinophagaceae bacterium]
MKSNILKIFATLFLSISFLQTVKAGFPVGNGRWLLSPTYTRYFADGYWDNTGIFNNFENKGRYQSDYFGLYGGIGIGRDVDLVFNIPFVQQRYLENGQIQESLQAVGDITVGLSYFLNHFDYYKHLSITGSLIFPAYPSIEQTYLLPGFNSTGGEIKMGLAGTNTNTLKDTYYDVEAGIRTYFNAGGPTMFFANATLGVPFNEDWKLSGTFNLVSSNSSTGFLTPTNIFINRDFSYLRGNISLGRRINRNITWFASIFRDFTGRSIGQGQGFSTYMVFKF